MCNHDQIVHMPILAVDYRINWEKRIYPAEIDACLAPLIFKLHKEGIKTCHSCCRHGRECEEGEGHVMIEKESVRLAMSLGYNVVSSWVECSDQYWSYRRFEIRFPDELIGHSNLTLEESREYNDKCYGRRNYYWGMAAPKKKTFPGPRDYKSCINR